MNKKIIFIVVIVLILFAGILAVTQEAQPRDIMPSNPVNEAAPEERTEYFHEIFQSYEKKEEIPYWVKPVRWFISNKGGMAVEEMPSQVTALRNEYALAVYFTAMDELPDYLLPYYNEIFFIEVRMLYEKGKQHRIQWLFRDLNGTVRLVSVIRETDEKETQKTAIVSSDEYDDENENDEIIDDINDVLDKKRYTGFIEIYDENALLVTEYRFYNDGRKSRTDYMFNHGLLISITFLQWEEDKEEYIESYADFLRYNRSLFLRSVERVFYSDRQLNFAEEPLRFSFPRRIEEMSDPSHLISEKINSYPEFFGEVTVSANNKIVYTTDERSRVVSQSLYDDTGSIIWVIENTWLNDRIISTSKTEDGITSLAQFEYDSSGDRIIERNFKNGVLERVVTTYGKTDIEELYFNGKMVLRAVWENGRKISETRVSSR